MEAIKTTELTKYYGKARGIIGLNLCVEEGECFGFIGPNGAGKSTTIRTLLGLISPSSGTASVLGKDIVAEKTAILKETGYLPSEAVFYAGMKVKDILKLSADLRGMDCSREADILCQRLQLDTSRKVDELSFGNRKKVAIVCALQSKPSLLILDEPTGGLDPLMQREFFEILKEENQRGATVFLSSHVLSEVQDHCKSAAFIRDGKILMHDKVANIEAAGAKKVSIKLEGKADIPNIPGISDLKEDHDKNNVEFIYKGDAKVLISSLSSMEIRDISITEPSLEDIFMSFYEGTN